MTFDDFVDTDNHERTEDIARDLHISHGTVCRMVNKFRMLLRRELVRTGVIENENYCRVEK